MKEKFQKNLNRLRGADWKEQCPMPDYWHFRKRKWHCFLFGNGNIEVQISRSIFNCGLELKGY